MAKAIVKLVVLVVRVALSLILMLTSGGLAQETTPEKVLVFLGGYGMEERDPNNLLNQEDEMGKALRDVFDETRFIDNADPDRVQKLNQIISSDKDITIAAFSAGGKTVYVSDADRENVTSIILIDSITMLPDAGDDDDVVNAWVQKTQDWVENGKKVQVYACNDDRAISARTQKYVKKIDSITDKVETKNVGGFHGRACINSFKDILQSLGE